jgi:hypothetical protein
MNPVVNGHPDNARGICEKGDSSIFAPVEQLDSVKAKIEEKGRGYFFRVLESKPRTPC